MLQLIRKDSGEGVVCARGKGRILVAPVTLNIKPAPAPPRKSCAAGGCGRCGGCMSLASIPNGYAGSFYVPVRDPAAFFPGDRVRFCRFIPEPNLMSALVFGIPVTFAMAVMLCWLTAAPREAETSYAVFSVAAAFFSGFIVLGFIDSLFRKKYPSSIIGPSIINDETGAGVDNHVKEHISYDDNVNMEYSPITGNPEARVDNHGKIYTPVNDKTEAHVDNHGEKYTSDIVNVNTGLMDGIAAHRETQNAILRSAKGGGGNDI